MATGKLQRVAVEFTDTTAPMLITRDELESRGSIFLFDGNHAFGQFAGLPVQGAAIPNVLSNKAALLMGVAESLTHSVVQSLPIPVVGVFKAERTTKGGIHGLITQAGGQTSRQNYFWRAGKPVQEYMRDHPNNTFYVSFWEKITRKAVTGAPSPQAPFYFVNGLASTANFRFHFEASLPSPRQGTPTNRGYKAVPAIGDADVVNGTNRFSSLGVQGNTGNGPVSADPINMGVGTEAAWNGVGYNKAASRIIYRAYIEDLTVSGRTYEEVEAIDFALYTAAFAVGGKFYGDTYTDPTTFP